MSDVSLIVDRYCSSCHTIARNKIGLLPKVVRAQCIECDHSTSLPRIPTMPVSLAADKRDHL